jgi:hypothetical protein
LFKLARTVYYRMERIRKATQFYDGGVPLSSATTKELIIPAGGGIKLAENKHFCKEIEKVKGDSDVVKALHTLLFHTAGKKLETKKHLRLFYGFDAVTDKEKLTSKIRDKKMVWTVALLKQSLDLMGLSKAGDREDLILRLVDYLMCPTEVKFGDAVSTSKSTSTIGTKRKSKGSADEPKLKKGPNAYQLYMMENRATIKDQNSNAGFGEIAKLVAKSWEGLDSDAKETWRNKAAVLKEEKFTKIIDAGAEEDDFADSDKDEAEKGEDKEEEEEEAEAGEEEGEQVQAAKVVEEEVEAEDGDEEDEEADDNEEAT